MMASASGSSILGGLALTGVSFLVADFTALFLLGLLIFAGTAFCGGFFTGAVKAVLERLLALTDILMIGGNEEKE
jgi:hypothetical protein